MGRLTILFGILMCLGFAAVIVLGVLSRGRDSYTIVLRFDYLVGGIISIVSGVWTLNVANSFRRVAEVTGRDIENVMGAVANLKKLYRLQAVLLLIAAVVVIAFAVVAAVYLLGDGGVR